MDFNRVIEIDIHKCIKALKQSVLLIITITLSFLLLGIIIGFFIINQEDEYQATTSIYGVVQGSASFTESEDIFKVMYSYSDIIKSNKVSERAELILGDPSITKEEIYNMVSIDLTSDLSSLVSSTIYIHTISDDSEKAVKVANAVADAFILEVANLTGQDDIQILDEAYDATIHYDASSTRLTVILVFTFLGLFFACTFIIMREVLSYRMVSPKDATLYGTLDIIGVIPDYKIHSDS